MNIKLLLAAVLAFSVGIAAFFLFSSGTTDKTYSSLTVQGECDLSQSECMANDQQGHEVSMILSPRPVPILKDVAVEISVQGMEAIRVAQVSIEGLNMYMGIQVIPLQLNKDGRGAEQKLTGVLKLPVCTTRKMEWNATLVMQTNNKEYRAAYPFTTIAP